MHPNSAACHWWHQDQRTHAVSPLCPQIGLVWACSHHPEKARPAAPLNLLYSSYHLAVSCLLRITERACHAWRFPGNSPHQPIHYHRKSWNEPSSCVLSDSWYRTNSKMIFAFIDLSEVFILLWVFAIFSILSSITIFIINSCLIIYPLHLYVCTFFYM